MRNRLYIVIIIILFLAFCGSQYLISVQNEVIEDYKENVEAYADAYRRCIDGRSPIIIDPHPKILNKEGEKQLIL